jgi:macrolide-specific efflux system membrane fusion protein
MAEPKRASWLVYALAALCIAAITIAFLIVGPSSRSAGVQSRIVTARQGIVQSTVSGSGNIEASHELNLGFKTSGVVQRILVHAGQHVVTGQLLAELDPESAEVSLEQARASLQSAEASLAQAEEDEGETSTTGSGQGATASAAAASAPSEGSAEPSSTAPTTSGSSTTNPSRGKAGPSSGSTSSESSSESSPSSTSPSSSSSTEHHESAATRAANIASANATVRSDKLAVQSAEEAVQDTRLYAPSVGTIVSLEGEVGESVSGDGTSKSSPSASSESASSPTDSSPASSSSSSASSSGSFAVLTDLESLQLVVALSESEVGHVHVGQPATVTIEALEGKKVAAHVTAVATTAASSSSGVVSYDVTFKLDQLTAGLKVGMSASVEVVVQQAEGVYVPTSAISGNTVTVANGSKREMRTVTTGLAGDSTTIVQSGLKAGEQVAMALATTTGSSGSSVFSRLSSRGSGGALGGTGGGFPGAGGFPGGGGAPVAVPGGGG